MYTNPDKLGHSTEFLTPLVKTPHRFLNTKQVYALEIFCV
jgi:hypothetical protein